MIGLETIAMGWNVPTLITDATGDATLLKAIWPQLEEPEPHGWQQLPRPENVRVFQLVDRTMAETGAGGRGQRSERTGAKGQKRKRRAAGYAAVLTRALEYGGAEVGVIIYKEAKEWIQKHCFVPDWMKMIHWGEHLGTNALQKVRALFVVGRWLAPAEAVARQTEALFGGYIAERDYRVRRKGGRIPIVPDADGNNCILVDVRDHAHPMVERAAAADDGREHHPGGRESPERAADGGRTARSAPLDRRAGAGAGAGRAGAVGRAGRRARRADAGGGRGSGWKILADAVRAFKGLFTADGLREARGGRRLWEGAGAFPFWTRGVWAISKRVLFRRIPHSSDFPSDLPARGRWL